MPQHGATHWDKNFRTGYTFRPQLLTIVYGRGGEEVLLDIGGQDATEAFEDVGHSDEAREILNGLLVGDLKRQVCLPSLSLSPHPNPHSLLSSPSASILLYSFSATAFRRQVPYTYTQTLL